MGNAVNVVCVVCSARKHGNTEILAEKAIEGAEKAGKVLGFQVYTKLLSLAGEDIKPCDACDTCHEKNICHIDDYITNKIIPEIVNADAIIIASPIYMHTISAQAKILMDRTNCLYTEDGESLLSNKVGGAIVVGQERQGGKAYGIMTILSLQQCQGYSLSTIRFSTATP
jgi:multimeric flavodoxin WrbA